LVARLAAALLQRLRHLTVEIDELTAELTTLLERLAPSLPAVPGCGVLTAAKVLGETAGVTRFRSRDAYALYSGVAPIPVWSSNHERHRLSRSATGNSTTPYTASA
jgi:transposase